MSNIIKKTKVGGHWKFDREEGNEDDDRLNKIKGRKKDLDKVKEGDE